MTFNIYRKLGKIGNNFADFNNFLEISNEDRIAERDKGQ